MSSNITCSSAGAATCQNNFQIAAGYYCEQSVCTQCAIGTYGTDGKTCSACPYGTWAPNLGQQNCSSIFSFSTPGLHATYIPFGVTKINIKLWGGGGGSDLSDGSDPSSPFSYISRAGGGGGFTSCNVTVPANSSIYVIVAGGGLANTGLATNVGGSSLIQYLDPSYYCHIYYLVDHLLKITFW